MTVPMDSPLKVWPSVIGQVGEGTSMGPSSMRL